MSRLNLPIAVIHGDDNGLGVSVVGNIIYGFPPVKSVIDLVEICEKGGP